MPDHEALRIVIADDDEDDRVLAHDALREAGVRNPLDFVADGEALLAHLRANAASPPALVLLDLNMPRLNGYEALREIRADAALRHLPVVVVSTSRRAEDVLASYRLGASGYLTKPASYAELVEALRRTCAYWLRTVQLPRLS